MPRWMQHRPWSAKDAPHLLPTCLLANLEKIYRNTTAESYGLYVFSVLDALLRLPHLLEEDRTYVPAVVRAVLILFMLLQESEILRDLVPLQI